MPDPPPLQLRGIEHRYGALHTLKGVDLTVESGQIHALIGENGAGKTTLVKIAAGQIKPLSGQILVYGDSLHLASRTQAAGLGIGVVHQHLSLVNELTVIDNLLLGRPRVPQRLDIRKARNEILDWSRRLNLEVNPDSRVGELALGIRQQIEILTCLAWGARVLIVDEPTAVLSQREADVVLNTLTRLRSEGVGILLVTHKMREVVSVADRITVLRGGEVVARYAHGTVSPSELATAMIGEGRTVASLKVHTPPQARVRLRLDSLIGDSINDLTLEVRSGEVVGIAGVAGNGQVALARAVAGTTTLKSGEVYVDDVRITGSPALAIRAGVSIIPEDRAQDGLALSLSAWKNAIVRSTHEAEFVGTGSRLNRGHAVNFCRRIMARLRVRPADPEVLVSRLSGGNQQRLIVSRELARAPSVVVAAEPTRGLDPAGAVDVAEGLLTIAESGAAVLLISSDLDELLALTHRILVLYRGRIVTTFEPSKFDAELIGLAMAGALSE